MATFVYSLCAVTSLVCCLLLLRHRPATRGSLLWSSAIAFLCFAIANILLVVDLILVPDIDLRLWRNSTTLLGVVFLLGALINANGRSGS